MTTIVGVATIAAVVALPVAAHPVEFGAAPSRPVLPDPERDPDLRMAYRAYQGGRAPSAYSAYLRAARRGQPIGQYNVAMMKFNGDGTPVDLSGAVRWLREAADGGLALAQYDLALLYENGDGVERSQPDATRWFRAAAEQGHVDAQLALATQLLLGRGVARDLAEAVHWYEAAAIAGNPDAQYTLASFYEHGEGVPADRGRALSWYAAAARQGDRAAIEKVRVLSEADAVERR